MFSLYGDQEEAKSTLLKGIAAEYMIWGSGELRKEEAGDRNALHLVLAPPTCQHTSNTKLKIPGVLLYANENQMKKNKST